MPSATYVATGTVRRAFFASSASTGACSNPTNPSTATTASTPIVPGPAEVSAPGDKVAKLRCPPAGCAIPPTGSAAVTAISAHSRTPSTRPVMSTRPRPPAPRPPRRMQTQVGGGLGGGVRPERPVQPDLQEAVGQQRDQRGGHPGDPAQAGRDEGVERAGVFDVPRHGDVPAGP